MYTNSRDEEVKLLKRLWASQPTACPKCGGDEMVHLHKKQGKVIVTGSVLPVVKFIEPSICLRSFQADTENLSIIGKFEVGSEIFMDKKMISNLLTIAVIGLLLSATIFICLCLFMEEKNNTYLGIALSSIMLSSLFNIIKRQCLK